MNLFLTQTLFDSIFENFPDLNCNNCKIYFTKGHKRIEIDIDYHKKSSIINGLDRMLIDTGILYPGANVFIEESN